MHKCHNPQCDKRCHPSKLMCLSCWQKVPKELQNEVYRCYRKGQEKDKNPSQEWLNAARAAIKSIQSK